MSAKVEKLENNEVKLTITIGADKFEEGMQKAFFRNAKYFSVPGFRKGKAPRNIVEKKYGEINYIGWENEWDYSKRGKTYKRSEAYISRDEYPWLSS